jgi:hypothetical protein
MKHSNDRSHPFRRACGNRTGQAAFEYLMSYSWAILAVMAVGITFWQIGVLGNSDDLITSMGFTYFRLISGMSYSTDGATVLYFQNTQVGAITFDPDQSSVVDTSTGKTCRFFPPPPPMVIYSSGIYWNTISPQTVPTGGQFAIMTDCGSNKADAIELEINLIYRVTVAGDTIKKAEHGKVRIKQKLSPGGLPICQDPLKNDIYTAGMACEPTYCYADFCCPYAFCTGSVFKVYCVPPLIPGGGGGTGYNLLPCPKGCLNGACIR